METYRVKISTAGQIVLHRNKPCRTPVEFKDVIENDMKFLELQARRLRLKIDIKSEKEIAKTVSLPDKEYKDVQFLNDDVEVEELKDDSEPKTILEKLMKDAN